MVKDNYMEFQGIVKSIVRDKIMVQINENYEVICTVSGKLRQSGIKLLPGDPVRCEVSAYDTTKGRITYRIK
jgi:translation initiation factor IF-1